MKRLKEGKGHRKSGAKPVSGKPPRKAGKKPAAKKGKTLSFRLVVEDQAMLVKYRPNAFGDNGQFEFRSPHKPPRRILVSETGYRCHFATKEEVKQAKSPQAYARDLVRSMLDARSPQRAKLEARGQLSLFG